MESLAIPYLVFVGSLLALQAAANVQLSSAMRSPVAASTLQLGIGAAILLVAVAIAGTFGAFGLVPGADPETLIGGLGSALYITAGILLFPRLGAVVTVGLFIAGQMLASLALDGFGWLGIEPVVLGPRDLLGALAVIAGAALIVRAQTGGGVVESAVRERPGWLGLALMAGAVLPLQGAVNAELRTEIDAPVTVAAFSFLIATVAMAAAMAGARILEDDSRLRVEPLRRLPWWGWLGGLCGATYVTSVFLLIPEIGVASTVALTVAGQQIASLFVDRYGLFRLPRREVSAVRLTGVGVLLAGVGLVQVA
jgi:bacterial/archaeal transporter family-2 protein